MSLISKKLLFLIKNKKLHLKDDKHTYAYKNFFIMYKKSFPPDFESKIFCKMSESQNDCCRVMIVIIILIFSVFYFDTLIVDI